ncbi:MAG: NADH-quinone oxidoreductase subunit J [Bdellovibrionaceae bacterium]|nr:NADH-quinone oxidoreductase subunit J [Pseudobdellovibrionaceae bacterium]|tara:strand:+ start:540 stop:1079 length:540 start_codon:yes stop_codon:yes gene_type:complete
MSQIQPVFFYFFAGVAIAFSLLVIFKKNPVSSAFSLVMVFFAFAGIYALLQAHLVATLQILVYTGAIMVLFVFVLMLLNIKNTPIDWKGTSLIRIGTTVGVSAMLAVFFIVSFKKANFVPASGLFSPERVDEMGGNTQVLAELMFSEYILPFELTSVLLLGAIVGTVAIAMRKNKRGES